ncbi:centrosomal protein of 112 kDa-like [Hylobates moloch]|uniref:centrosomal protein of 112 kDa-like n=1 Tax=Hylobates moloch TaxID=81572 RepID=UPI00267683F0|nr:centrosomal protein of 112 kDa-like [Hylobates moloch]
MTCDHKRLSVGCGRAAAFKLLSGYPGSFDRGPAKCPASWDASLAAARPAGASPWQRGGADAAACGRRNASAEVSAPSLGHRWSQPPGTSPWQPHRMLQGWSRGRGNASAKVPAPGLLGGGDPAARKDLKPFGRGGGGVGGSSRAESLRVVVPDWIMEVGSEEEKWEKLDAEFDHFVVDMKPFVLKLPHRTERQRCALWIRKLCEPSGTGAGIMGRKNRNLYAKLLLHMLKRGVLEGPFTHRPEPGTLKILPSYMSIYFDEPNPARAKGSSPEGLPAWVLGEPETSEHKLNESWKLSSGEDDTLVQSPTDVYSREQYAGKLRMRSHSLSPTQREDGQNNIPKICNICGNDYIPDDHKIKKKLELTCSEVGNTAFLMKEACSKKSPVSLDDSDIEARLNSWNLGVQGKLPLEGSAVTSVGEEHRKSFRKTNSFCQRATSKWKRKFWSYPFKLAFALSHLKHDIHYLAHRVLFTVV